MARNSRCICSISNHTALILASLLTSTAMTFPARAQAQGEAGQTQQRGDEQMAGDIVVTAQKRAQSLSDVPISVSVIGGDEIKSGGITNIVDLAPRLPNVNMYAGGQSDIISIRGIGSGSNAGFEQAVATFVDGAYRGRSRSIRASLFDLERVEVLRGPQSTFFGNNAIAGAFNITTRKANPGDDFAGDFSALYEPDHDEYDIKGGLSVPLGETLAARIAVGKSGMEGWVRNATTDHKEPKQDDLIGRISLAWEPSGSWRTDLRIDGGRFRTKGVPFTNEITNCPPPALLGLAARGACAAYLAALGPNADTMADYRGALPETYAKTDFVEAVLSNAVELGAFSLNAVTTYFEHSFDQSISLIPISVTSPAGTGSWFEFYSGETYSQFSQDLRLQSPSDKPVRVTLGAYYLNGKLNNYIRPVPTFLPFGTFLSGLGYTATTRFAAFVSDRRTENVYSIYGVVNVDLSRVLRLNLGGRYSISDKIGHRSLVSGTTSVHPLTLDADFSGFQPASAANQPAINGVLGFQAGDFPNNRRSDKRFMPSAGIEYDVASDVMAYATYARGAKAGGWSMGTSANEFNAESVDGYEVGIKGTVLARKLFFSVAAFRSDYKDLQEAANNALPNGSFVIEVRNAARARAQGIELSLNARLSRFITLNFDGAYLDSKYVSFPNAPCNTYQSAIKPTNCTQDLSGIRRPLASTWSGAISGDIRFPVGVDYRIKFTPVLSYRSRFNMLTTIDPVTEQRGYAKVDARLGFGKEHSWEVALVGKNLTNTKDALFINTLVSSPGSSAAQISRPRSVALQASISF